MSPPPITFPRSGNRSGNRAAPFIRQNSSPSVSHYLPEMTVARSGNGRSGSSQSGKLGPKLCDVMCGNTRDGSQSGSVKSGNLVSGQQRKSFQSGKLGYQSGGGTSGNSPRNGSRSGTVLSGNQTTSLGSGNLGLQSDNDTSNNLPNGIHDQSGNSRNGSHPGNELSGNIRSPPANDKHQTGSQQTPGRTLSGSGQSGTTNNQPCKAQSDIEVSGNLKTNDQSGCSKNTLCSGIFEFVRSRSCMRSGSDRTIPDWMVVLLVSAFASGCYLNSLHGQFVHDDLVAVSGNPDVNGRNGPTALLWNDFWGRPMADPTSHKSYRPVTVFTFRLNWLLFGDGVFSFHLTNVLLHVCVVCLLLTFCREVLAWRRDASLVAALLFAAHPLHTEAVSNVVGRADVLCCVFYLSSLIACSKDSLWCQGVSLVCAGLALFTKEQGITVLGVCLLYHLLILHERNTANSFSNSTSEDYECKQVRCHLMDNGTTLKILARIAVLLVVTCGLCYLRMCVINGPLPQFSDHDNPAAFAKAWTTRLLTYLYLPAFNLWLVLCPSVLSYDWQMGSVPLVEHPLDPRNAASAAYLLLIPSLLVRAATTHQRLERRRILLSLSLMVFSFLPASNLLVTVGFVVAERVLYIPSLGFCLLVSHGLQRLMQRGPVIASICRAGALLLILLFVLKTMNRNNVWANREALVRSGLVSVPHNAKVHYNYANYKKDIGDKNAAIEHYRIALRLWPNYYTAHNNLGTLLEDGEENFRQAIAINPYYAKAYYNLASLYVRRGEWSVAESLLLRSIQLDPEFVPAVSSLASLYAEKGEGRLKEAERLYVWAVTLDPGDADVLNNYGFFLETHGRGAEALTQYERAMRAQPNHTVAIINAARSLRTQEHSWRAEELYKRALAIQEDPQVMDNLAMLYFASGRHQEARTMYRNLLENYPDRNETKLNYAQLLIQERSFEQAERLLLSLANSPISRESFLHLATLYNRTNRTAEALDTILRALRLCSAFESGCAKYHEEHGDILKDMDDYDAAEESYRLALNLDPKLAKTHQNLAVIYHIKGNYTSAEHHYKEAYKLDSSPQVLLDNMRKLQRRIFAEDATNCWRTAETSPCRGLQ